MTVQPPFSTIRCKSLAASLIPLLPCPMFTRIPAGFPPRPTAPVTAAAPFPVSPPSQILNRAQTRHTRHARVGLTPIPSIICAQFPSHRGVGVPRASLPFKFHFKSSASLSAWLRSPLRGFARSCARSTFGTPQPLPIPSTRPAPTLPETAKSTIPATAPPCAGTAAIPGTPDAH